MGPHRSYCLACGMHHRSDQLCNYDAMFKLSCSRFHENADLRLKLAEACEDRNTAKRLLDSACNWIDGAHHHDGCKIRDGKGELCSCGLDQFKRIRALIPPKEADNG